MVEAVGIVVVGCFDSDQGANRYRRVRRCKVGGWFVNRRSR
jgi:hypothetical protein